MQNENLYIADREKLDGGVGLLLGALGEHTL